MSLALGYDRALIDRAQQGDKAAVSHLVSLFEDQRETAIAQRAQVLSLLQAQPARKTAVMIGFTGTPGSGKSSLLARLTLELLGASKLSVAVLAIDPSSHVSGGALLGDRTRMRLPPDERRLFFRSQASATELGGLGPWSFQVCRLLSYCFDCVLVETVGIGQSEADIRHLADRVYLVLQPLAGDEVQFLKAGIMEVPHAFILNKCDDPSSDRSYHQLKGSVGLARPWDSDSVPIYRTSARTGAGLAELCAGVIKEVEAHKSAGLSEKEPYFFERWVRDEWGRFGVRVLDAALGGARAYLEKSSGFERAQADFAVRLRDELASGRASFDKRRT
jgi:LAO/AO transport system kinase